MALGCDLLSGEGVCVVCVFPLQKQQVAGLLHEAQKWREKYSFISLADTKQLLVSGEQ